MKKVTILFLLILNFSLSAQVEKTIEIEISGRPSWQKIIPLGKDGLIFIIKKDVTKAIIARFDSNLKKTWETEIFLDVEKEPTSYTLDSERVTFVFSENQGMYYQVFSVELKDGKFENKGFELRDFFQDQSYVYFKNRILLTGMNEKGASFYNYSFQENSGDFISAELAGKVQVQYFKFIPQKNIIEGLWSIKESGYSNEKKKKGEFIKDAFVIYAQYDTSGRQILKNIIPSNVGNFPLTAKLTEIDATTKIFTGTYQSNNGTKGIYFSKFEDGKITYTKYYDYKTLLKGTPDFDENKIKTLSNDFVLLQIQPIFDNKISTFGGTFYQPNFQIVSSNNTSILDANYSNNKLQRSQSKRVLKGYNFEAGFVASVDFEGNLITQNRINLNQISPQIDETLAINIQNDVAYCLKGILVVCNTLNFSNKNIHKLSDEQYIDETKDDKNARFLPNYYSVKDWYEKYFIAIGSRIKFEAIKDSETQLEKPSRRKKGQQNLPQTNIKKIIYLSKIKRTEF